MTLLENGAEDLARRNSGENHCVHRSVNFFFNRYHTVTCKSL
jgi:hypothetical protein